MVFKRPFSVSFQFPLQAKMERSCRRLRDLTWARWRRRKKIHGIRKTKLNLEFANSETTIRDFPSQFSSFFFFSPFFSLQKFHHVVWGHLHNFQKIKIETKYNLGIHRCITPKEKRRERISIGLFAHACKISHGVDCFQTLQTKNLIMQRRYFFTSMQMHAYKLQLFQSVKTTLKILHIMKTPPPPPPKSVNHCMVIKII